MMSKVAVTGASAAAALVSVLTGADRSHAQAYPSQQIKLVVPFAPGGLTDLLGRLAAEQIKAKTGQTVIVESRSGAGGNTGLAQVAQSPADGYTIALAGVTSFTVNPLIYKTMPLDPMKELVPAGALAETPLVLTTNAKALPYATLTEFIAHVKQHPGKYNFGSSGTGTPAHILVDHVLRQAGLKVQHVSYRGIAPAITDMLSGNVQIVGASPAPVVAHAQAGTLKLIAALAPKRLPFLPDVPTTEEAGLPRFDAVGWWGIVAPAATPKAVIDRLDGIFLAMADDPEIRARLLKVYMLPLKMSAAAMAAQLKTDVPMWAKIVKDAGLKPE